MSVITHNPIEIARRTPGPSGYGKMIRRQDGRAQMNNPAYPRSKSKESIDVRYTYAPINKPALFLAQQYARFARNCSGKVAEGYVNKANYLMTEAYEGGEENEAFWDQFV